MRITSKLLFAFTLGASLLLAVSCVPSRSRSDNGGGGAGEVHAPSMGEQPGGSALGVHAPTSGDSPDGVALGTNSPADGGSGGGGGGTANSCAQMCAPAVKCFPGEVPDKCISECEGAEPGKLACFEAASSCEDLYACAGPDIVGPLPTNNDSRPNDPPAPASCEDACQVLSECGTPAGVCQEQICGELRPEQLECIAALDDCEQATACME